MRDERRKEEKSKPNNKAKQHSTPNELPWVRLKPTSLDTPDRALYHMCMYTCRCGVI